jgi:uncharacterized protein YkwD
MRRLIPLLLLLPMVHACSSGGDSGGGGGGMVVTPTPTPAPGATPTPTPSATPTPTTSEPATGTDFFAGIGLLYTTQPNIGGCQAGTHQSWVGTSVLASLNAIRAEHGLPAVAYAAADEAPALQSSLMMAANGQLSHTPPTSWACYSSAGAASAGASNIYLAGGSGLRYTRNEDILIGWMTDVDNVVADNVGHRRWLLYPWLSTVAYGRVAGTTTGLGRADAATIKVINTSQASPASLPAFVAYPYEDYPARYFDTSALLSFGVIANPSSAFAGANSNVNYSGATVSVRVRGGGALAVSRQTWDNQGFGLPNNLQFAVAGLANNVTYDVTIDRVNVGGTMRTFTYFFRLVP